jgi:hypothetical protein
MKHLTVGFLTGAAVTAIGALAFMGEGSTTPTDAAVADGSDIRIRTDDVGARSAPARSSAPLGTEMPTAAPRAPPDEQAPAPAGRVAVAEIPGASLAVTSDSNGPRERLLEAFRIDCLYGPGHGGNWSKGDLSPHTAAWQGGIVTFDTIDLAAGTARLKNSSGLTRTLDGELEVRAQATDTGVHFTVFAPGGELIVATVYGVLDSQSKHAAVASFHGPHLDHESAQFYGACTLS